jgi:deoxyxylulose-5-phosphate synthase
MGSSRSRLMKLNRDKMTAGQKAAFTKKWREASRKAHRTGKNAKTFTKYFLAKGGYRYMDLDSKKGYEYKGVVDLIAVKRDTKDPDLLTIVLFRVKGGWARITPNEVKRLRKAVRRITVQWNVAEKPGKAVKFKTPLL